MGMSIKKETYIFIDASYSFSYSSPSGKNSVSCMRLALDAAKEQAIEAKKSHGIHAVYARLWHENSADIAGFNSAMSPAMIEIMSQGLGDIFTRSGGVASFTAALKQCAQEISGRHANNCSMKNLIIITDGAIYENPKKKGEACQNLAALMDKNPDLAVSFLIAKNSEFQASASIPPIMDMLHDAGIREKVHVVFCEPQHIKNTLADIMTEKKEAPFAPEASSVEEDEVVTILNILQDAMDSAAQTADRSGKFCELSPVFRAVANLAETLRNHRCETLEEVKSMQQKDKDPKRQP